GSLAPDGAAHEQRLAVLPLVALAVELTGGRRDREVRDRGAGGGEAQLRVPGQVADHGDEGVASHGLPRSVSWVDQADSARGTSARRTLVRSTASFRPS